MPLGAWKMPPRAQSLGFRESTAVNKGKDEKTTNVVLRFDTQLY